jgi:hypothetical protein
MSFSSSLRPFVELPDTLSLKMAHSRQPLGYGLAKKRTIDSPLGCIKHEKARHFGPKVERPPFQEAADQ